MNKCLETIYTEHPFSHVIVAFSGGPDSTALLMLLNNYRKHFSYTIEAIHFQHQLRGEASLADEQWSQSFCLEHSIPFTCINLNINKELKPKQGIESQARELRLEHLIAACRHSPLPAETVIALGHTSDDKIENVFIRLCRGSNLTGLTSLKPISYLKKATLIRPLLAYSKQDIYSYLESQNITNYCVDHTNQENIYTRNIIRNEVLPALFSTSHLNPKGLLQSLKVLTEDADYIDREALKVYHQCLDRPYKQLKRHLYTSQHPAMKVRVLRLWLSEFLDSSFIPNKRLFNRLDTELANTNNNVLIPITGTYPNTFIKLSAQDIELYHSPQKSSQKQITWNWQKHKQLTWNDITLTARVTTCAPQDFHHSDESTFSIPRSHINNNSFLIREWQPGDKMVPFSHSSEVKLKKLFNSAKVKDKTSLPLICLTSGEIIWIPFIKRSAKHPVPLEKDIEVIKITAIQKGI